MSIPGAIHISTAVTGKTTGIHRFVDGLAIWSDRKGWRSRKWHEPDQEKWAGSPGAKRCQEPFLPPIDSGDSTQFNRNDLAAARLPLRQCGKSKCDDRRWRIRTRHLELRQPESAHWRKQNGNECLSADICVRPSRESDSQEY